MTSIELFALAFTVFTVGGTLLNYNLVYATVNKKKEWNVTRLFNNGFARSHDIFGWVHYVVALLLYGFWSLWFNEDGFGFSSLTVDVFVITRIMAWFVLSQRAKSLKERQSRASFGPSGKLEEAPTETA